MDGVTGGKFTETLKSIKANERKLKTMEAKS
jgi:hypothetical protein